MHILYSDSPSKQCVLLGGVVRNLKPHCGHFIHHYLLTGTIWIMTRFTLDSGIMAQMMRDNTRPLKENFISTLNILMGLDRARNRRVSGGGGSVCRIRSSEPQIMEHSLTHALTRSLSHSAGPQLLISGLGANRRPAILLTTPGTILSLHTFCQEPYPCSQMALCLLTAN